MGPGDSIVLGRSGRSLTERIFAPASGTFRPRYGLLPTFSAPVRTHVKR